MPNAKYFKTPGVVPGRSPTARNIPEAGTSAWQRRSTNVRRSPSSGHRRLVGGLFFLLVAVSSMPARADEVRLEWAPVAPLSGPGNVVSVYVLEREDQAGAWHQVASVRHAVDEPAYDGKTGRFRVTVAGDPREGRWRFFAVDDVGNSSRPVELRPAPPSCSWGVEGLRVPVGVMGEARPPDCDRFVQVLEDARALLLEEGVCRAEPMSAELQQLRAVVVTDSETIRRQCPGAPMGVHGCYGSTPAGERFLYLLPNGGAAFHELAHLCLGLRPGQAPGDHQDWERSPRLLELDLRFQESHR